MYSCQVNAQAVSEFLYQEPQEEIAYLALGDVEVIVLNDIRQFLHVPHTVQEIVSADKTPTLSLVLPMYEKLIVMLNNLKQKLPKLAHAISSTVNKLDEFLGKSRETKIYILAMGM